MDQTGQTGFFPKQFFFLLYFNCTKEGWIVERKSSQTDYYGVIVAMLKTYCFFLPFSLYFSFALPTNMHLQEIPGRKTIGVWRGKFYELTSSSGRFFGKAAFALPKQWHKNSNVCLRYMNLKNNWHFVKSRLRLNVCSAISGISTDVCSQTCLAELSRGFSLQGFVLGGYTKLKLLSLWKPQYHLSATVVY